MIFWFSYSAVKKSRPDSARYRVSVLLGNYFGRQQIWNFVRHILGTHNYQGEIKRSGSEKGGGGKTSVYTVKEEMKEGQTR